MVVSTGAILFLVKWAEWGEKFHKLLTLSLLPFLVIGLYGFLYSLDKIKIGDIYCHFYLFVI